MADLHAPRTSIAPSGAGAAYAPAVDTPTRDELRTWTAALTLEALDPADPAEDRYVPLHEAGRAAVDEMMATIDLALDTTTQLLSGPSGSGKTTELNRLRGKLDDAGFRTLMFDVTDYVNESAPVYVTEFLIALALGAHDALRPSQGERRGVLPRLSALLRRLRISLDVPGFSAHASATGGGVEAFGVSAEFNLERELKTSRPFVDELRTKLRHHVGELYAEVSEFIGKDLLAGEDPGLGWVVIVDGLEKLRGVTGSDAAVQVAAAELFVGHANELKFASHHTIYTVPPYLRFVTPGALPYDSRVLQVPVPHVRPRADESADAVEKTRAELRRAVALRVPVGRIFTGDDQLDRMVLASGGHLRDLFTLLRQLVNLMRRRSLELPVTDDDVDEAIGYIAHDFMQMTAEQRDLLITIAEHDGTFEPPNDQVQLMTRLLTSHMLLFHRNGKDWYEVHPLTRRALDRR